MPTDPHYTGVATELITSFSYQTEYALRNIKNGSTLKANRTKLRRIRRSEAIHTTDPHLTSAATELITSAISRICSEEHKKMSRFLI